MALGNIFRGLQARALAKGNPGTPPAQAARPEAVGKGQRHAMQESRKAAQMQKRQEHEAARGVRKGARMNERMMKRQARKKAMAGI